MPAGASLSNCYRGRKGDGEGEQHFAVPQSFTFMAREGRRGMGGDVALQNELANIDVFKGKFGLSVQVSLRDAWQWTWLGFR